MHLDFDAFSCFLEELLEGVWENQDNCFAWVGHISTVCETGVIVVMMMMMMMMMMMISHTGRNRDVLHIHCISLYFWSVPGTRRQHP